MCKCEKYQYINFEEAELDEGGEGENENTDTRDKLHLFGYFLNALQ